MAWRPLPVADVLRLLAQAPARLTALAAGATPVQLRTPPTPGEWSANEVLAHMRSCADTWGGAALRIADGDRPTIRAVNPLTWIRSTDYLELDFSASLDAFARQRRQLLDVLQPLPPEGWARPATVTGAGAPLTRTVHFYAQWLAEHERLHLRQVERAIRTPGA